MELLDLQGNAAARVGNLVDIAAEKFGGLRALVLSTYLNKLETGELRPSLKAGTMAYPFCGKLVSFENLGIEIQAVSLYHCLIKEDFLHSADATGNYIHRMSFSAIATMVDVTNTDMLFCH